jgi:hypothetical protein
MEFVLYAQPNAVLARKQTTVKIEDGRAMGVLPSTV